MQFLKHHCATTGLKLFVVFFGVLLFAGQAFGGKTYEIIVLGDLHFDGSEFHELGSEKPDFYYDDKEVSRNLNAWRKATPNLLGAAAAKVAQPTAFIAQLGDMVQGDCGNTLLHRQMLFGAWRQLKTFFPTRPVFLAVGNHDRRGPGAAAAYSEVIPKLLSTEANGHPIPEKDFFIRAHQDVFIFLDDSTGTIDLDFLKKTLQDHADARYRFVLTHIPVLPLAAVNQGYLYQKPEEREKWNEVVELLRQSDVILLSAHLHRTAVADFDFGKDGKLSQLVCFSMGSDEGRKEATELKKKVEEYTAAPGGETNEMTERRHNLAPFLGEFLQYRHPGGYAVLTISDQNVAYQLYLANEQKPSFSGTLRQKSAAASSR